MSSSHCAAVSDTTAWTPSSWRSKNMQQAVEYPDSQTLIPVLEKLKSLPPIVTPTEIDNLRIALKDVAEGRAFLLQGGDCAELFSYCSSSQINAKIKLLLQMSLVLVWGIEKPVVRIGRMAGQYAKPRSSPTEPRPDGSIIPSFRGDILNGYERELRTLDPARLLEAYWHSATTMNFVRAQISSGIADLHNPLDWDLGHVRDQQLQEKYSNIASSIQESLRFMKTVGADTGGPLKTVELFSSHEGLVLEYEEALVRKVYSNTNRGIQPNPSILQEASASTDVKSPAYFASSAHFLWIGDRTRQLDGGHVEFFRGIQNPIGIKVGPSMRNTELVRLLDIVNPEKIVGKVTLITRYGASKVEALLGGHIDAVKRSGHVVVWQCDPMHGNTHSTASGIKTRRFQAIFGELASALKIHKANNSYLGGMHLELTGDAVTECVGGSEGLEEQDLNLNYTSYCDPRLNEKQALELAFLVAEHYRAKV